MKKLKVLGIVFALLFCSHAFAGGMVYFETCASCTPSNSRDPVVLGILNYWGKSGLLRPGDIVSIMEDVKDPETGDYPVTNWKWQSGSFIRDESGYAKQASTPSGGSGGDGRTWVTVGQVLVMYPNPPIATVTVEGIIQSGAGGGGCNPKISGTICASLTGADPGAVSQ